MRHPFSNLAWAGSFALSAFSLSAPAVAQPDPTAPAPTAPAQTATAQTATAQTATGASEAETGKLAIAREIVANGFPVDQREEMFGRAMDAMLEQVRATMFASLKNDPGAEKLVNDHVNAFIVEGKSVLSRHIPGMMDAVAVAYSHEFSLCELQDLRSFSATPTGRHFFLRNSAILSDPSFRAANEAYMRELMPPMEKMRSELTDALTAYFVKHPPKQSSGS